MYHEGSLVGVYLRKERFLMARTTNSSKKRVMPWKVIKKIDNAYRVELPAGLNISNIFNGADLSPFYESEQLAGEDDVAVNSISGSSEVGEDDASGNDASEDCLMEQALAFIESLDQPHGVYTLLL